MSHPLQDCTMLIAHPDDEVIFGWPALPYAKRIVCASNDKHNPERQWCSRRGEALAEVGKILGIEVVCFDYNSEFYRLPHRDGQLKQLQQKLCDACCGSEKIFTHNAWGEYGNIDHMIVHQMSRVFCNPFYANFVNNGAASWFESVGVCGSRCFNEELDERLLLEVKAIYDRFGCWTWSFPVTSLVEVYRCS